MTTTELDKFLMAHYTVESMIGTIDCYIPHNDEPSVAELLSFAPDYAIKSKAFLCNEYINPDTASGVFIRTIKKHIETYIGDNANLDNKAMKYLLYQDKDIIAKQISMLVMHAQFKDVEDIFNIPSFVSMRAISPESVSNGMSIYLYYTLLVNKSLQIEDYNGIFVNAWCNYYENWEARIMMFRMSGNRWKENFSGVLLD